MNALHQRLKLVIVSPTYWRVTIDNPPINLYDPEMFAEMRALMSRIEVDPALQVVVFDSANPDYFMAHYDMVRGSQVPDLPHAAEFSAWPDFVTRLVRSPVVSIACIRGRARGHGSEFTLACDMRFASCEQAVFAQIEMGVCVVPGGGATEWLPALVGRSRALEIILGADDFDAVTAERYGWINRAIPDAELDAFVDNLARRIAGFDKRNLALAKELINARSTPPSEADRLHSNHSFVGTTRRPEPRQIVTALMRNGLQTDSELERRLGHYVGAAKDAAAGPSELP